MRKLSADYRFNHFTYSMASMIEGLATEPSSMIEIRWMYPEVVESIVKFSKITIHLDNQNFVTRSTIAAQAK